MDSIKCASQFVEAFNSGDLEVVFGIRPTGDSELIFGYMRLDQTGLEFPGQVFDTVVCTLGLCTIPDDLQALADSTGACVAALVGQRHRPEPATSGGPGRDVVQAAKRLLRSRPRPSDN